MTQIIQHVAYGMNSEDIPKMTNKQLISAFFQAETNLPSIKPEYRQGIRHNMAMIGDEMSDRVDRTRGKQARIRLEVHLMCMQEIIKKLYNGTIAVGNIGLTCFK